MDFDESLLHSDLSALENLNKFSFESKMFASQKFSSRIMDGSEVNMNLAFKENIMPWELEIFAAYSVIYNDDSATEIIDVKSFADAITYIRNYWDSVWNEAEQNGTYAEAFMMRSAIQQFPVQGVIFQKLYRYNYFFNFQNACIDMQEEFRQKFTSNYSDFELTAFALFLLLSKCTMETVDPRLQQQVLCKLFSNKPVMDALCIDKDCYIAEIQKLYHGDMIKLFYGLKAHYWWPFIGAEKFTYIPLPFLIINAVTDSMLNRLTLSNQRLRNLIGKEVIENYLYDIYSQVDTVTWISPEIEYSIGRKQYRTSDVLVAENEYCCFYDTKEMVPSLKVRELDADEIEKDISIYAKAVIQIYTQIINYAQGYFDMDKHYEKEKIFGVVVMLEDIALSRQKMYHKSFVLYQDQHGELCETEKQFIQSHIKVVSLRQVELMVLQNSSFLPCLLQQENHPENWNDLNFTSPTTENGLIHSYDEYVKSLKSDFIVRFINE